MSAADSRGPCVALLFLSDGTRKRLILVYWSPVLIVVFGRVIGQVIDYRAIGFKQRASNCNRGFNRLKLQVLPILPKFFLLNLPLGGPWTCFELAYTLLSAIVPCLAGRLCRTCALSFLIRCNKFFARLSVVPFLVNFFLFFPAQFGFNFVFFLFIFF